MVFSSDGSGLYFTASDEATTGYDWTYSGPASLFSLGGASGMQKLGELASGVHLDDATAGPAPDPQAPRQPSALLAGSRLQLAWKAAPARVRGASYVVDRFDGVRAGGTATRVFEGSATSFSDRVIVGRTYTYEISTVAPGGGQHGPARISAIAALTPVVRLPRLLSDSTDCCAAPGTSVSVPLTWGPLQPATDVSYLGLFGPKQSLFSTALDVHVDKAWPTAAQWASAVGRDPVREPDRGRRQDHRSPARRVRSR